MIKDGIINIYKPQNMTSQDAVAIVKKTLKIKKAGHTGTLDPMATGVLPICLGKATRIMDYLAFDIKVYRCKFELGKTTDTQDIWGDVIDNKDFDSISEDDIRNAFSKFVGVIEQCPPMYSALKHEGKKLYEYAREGKELPKDIKRRKTYIKNIDILDIDLENGTVEFDVSCSKGTYVRTICHDIGQILSCGACMIRLERLKNGVFTVDNAISIEELKDAMFPLEKREDDVWEDAHLPLVSIDYPLTNMGTINLTDDGMDKLINGVHLPSDVYEIKNEPEPIDESFLEMLENVPPRFYKAYHEKSGFIGVCYFSDKYKKMVADKVFYITNHEDI